MQPSLKQVLDIYGLRAQKSLSQNFILNPNLLEKIARLAMAGKPARTCFIEIGPGPGSLTRPLLKASPSKLISVEYDERFRPALSQLAEAAGLIYTPIFADALNLDAYLNQELVKDFDHISIVGNLPYAIASVLLQRLIKKFEADFPALPRDFTFMFQKEVAQRIASRPKIKAYGRLSVISQYAYKVKIPMVLGRQEFHPKPKVDSALVQLVSLPPDATRPTYEELSKLTSVLFERPKKMISVSLKTKGIQDWSGCHLNPALRPKSLTPQDFISLTKWVKSHYPEFFFKFDSPEA